MDPHIYCEAQCLSPRFGGVFFYGNVSGKMKEIERMLSVT